MEEEKHNIWEHLAEKEIIENIFRSFSMLQYMGKPQCIHFEYQIQKKKEKKTCAFHSNVATNLKELQFVLSITLHNKLHFKKKAKK